MHNWLHIHSPQPIRQPECWTSRRNNLCSYPGAAFSMQGTADSEAAAEEASDKATPRVTPLWVVLRWPFWYWHCRF
jgi:hypothetical protein